RLSPRAKCSCSDVAFRSVQPRRVDQPRLPPSGNVTELLDDGDEFVGSVALVAGEDDEFFRLGHNGALLWGASDGDAAAPPECEEVLVAELRIGSACVRPAIARGGTTPRSSHYQRPLRGRGGIANQIERPGSPRVFFRSPVKRTGIVNRGLTLNPIRGNAV